MHNARRYESVNTHSSDTRNTTTHYSTTLNIVYGSNAKLVYVLSIFNAYYVHATLYAMLSHLPHTIHPYVLMLKFFSEIYLLKCDSRTYRVHMVLLLAVAISRWLLCGGPINAQSTANTTRSTILRKVL